MRRVEQLTFENNDAGTITDAYGVKTFSAHNSTGTIVNAYGLWLVRPKI